MSTEDQLKSLDAQHGGWVYHRGWVYCQDGHVCEWNEMYGLRSCGEQSDERKREVQQFYWQTKLDRFREEFNGMKDQCQAKAESATLSAKDKQELRELQQQVRHAAKQLEVVSTPPGPSDKEIRAAKRLYYERKELVEQVKRAEAMYHEALQKTNGRQTNRSNKLGLKWQEAWDAWDEANRAYNARDPELQRAANLECWNEEREQRANEQLNELESIEV